MKIVNLILRLIVGGVFIASAVAKILDVKVVPTNDEVDIVPVSVRFSHVPDLATFAQDVANYHVPPRALTNLVAITLPWIELLAGALLVFGIWKRASAVVITAMMVVFLIAIGQAVIRGFNINCGCFGSVDARKVGVTALAQDVVLLGMAAWLAWRLKDGTTASNGGNQ